MGGVLGFAKEVLHLAGGMATEAVRGVLFGAALERKDRVLDESFRNLGIIAVGCLNRVRVGFRRAVAGLATLDIRLIGKSELRMSGLIELDQLILVATTAGIRASKGAGWSVIVGSASRDRWALSGFRSLLSSSAE